jgi:4'-phosphopantetheinyl transferase
MLKPKFITIWKIPQGDAETVSEAELAELRAWLSPEELARADAFRGEGYRRDYLLAHASLRWVLGECLSISPASVGFAAGSFREPGAAAIKPELRNAGLDLRFNLSHTRGAALVAVTLGREVGIDIEWQRPMDDLEGMARSVMSDKEHEQWLGLVAEDRAAAFYHLWTRKESYLKAIGLGLFRDLHEVTVPVWPRFLDAAAGAFTRVEDRSGDGDWVVGDIAAAEGYSAAVCCEGTEKPSIRIEKLDRRTLLDGGALF